jgi:hypothetical protein
MYYRSPCLFFRNIVRSTSSCFGARQDHYGAQGFWLDHPCARGLARPLSALGPSGTRQTTPCSGTSGQTTLCSGTASITLRLRLGDFVARSSTCARGLPRSLSDHGSGTSSLAPRPVLGDCLDRSPTMAWGLRRSLLDLCSGTASTTFRPRLGDFASRLHVTGNSHIVGIFFSHLDLATRLIPRLPASSGTTLVRCTYRCISYRLYDGWILNLTGNSF